MIKKIALAGVISFATFSAAQAENAVNPAHVSVVKAKFCSPNGRDTFTQNGDGTYTFNGVAPIKSNVSRAGGRPDGNPAMNFAQNGNEFRVEWLSTERVQIEVWKEGERAGQTKNNPPAYTFVYTRC